MGDRGAPDEERRDDATPGGAARPPHDEPGGAGLPHDEPGGAGSPHDKPGGAGSPHEKHWPSMHLIRACRGHHRLAHGVFDDIGLHAGQAKALLVLFHRDGLTHGALAQAMQVTPATVSNMVRGLEQAGLVERRRSADDERVSHVFLTEAGRGAQSKIESAMTRINALAYAGFSEDERTAAEGYLARIAANLHRAAEADNV